MADLTPAHIDNLVSAGVGLLTAVGTLLLWASRQAIGLLVLWVRRRITGARPGVVGSSSGAHKVVGPDPSEAPTRTMLPAVVLPDERPKIKDHFIFIVIDGLIARRADYKCGGCAARDQLLRDMLFDYLTAWKESFSKFCEAEIAAEGFETRGVTHITSFSNRVAAQMLAVQEEVSNRWTAHGVPTAAVLAFKHWEAKLFEILANHGEKIAQSVFFQTNRERLVALLTHHATFLAFVTLEAKTVLRNMNGTLNGAVYKQQVIQPIEHHGTSGHFPPADITPDPQPVLDTGHSKKNPAIKRRPSQANLKALPDEDGR